MVGTVRAAFGDTEGKADFSETLQKIRCDEVGCVHRQGFAFVSGLFTEEFLQQPAYAKEQQLFIVPGQPLQLRWSKWSMQSNVAGCYLPAKLIQIIQGQYVLVELLP
jgi:hypothetical protein